VLTIPASVLRGQYVENGVTRYAYCPLPEIPIQQCNPNAGPSAENPDFKGLSDNDFVPRPVGGSTLLEGNVEYRFSLLRRYNLSGAVFVDGAIVGSSFTEVADGVAAVTPGFGFRYRSPVGPIRLDVGINPSLSEELRVITESDSGATRGLVQLTGVANPADPKNPLVRDTRTFAAYKRGKGVGSALGRLTLHLSIGEAF
jgi:hypothetical protein